MLDSTASRRQFWLLWVVASASGGAVVALVARAAAYSTGYAVGGAAGTVIGEAALGVVALGGFMSAIGAAQWLVMLKQFSWAGRWWWASGLSGAVAGAVMLGVFAAANPVAGVILGLMAFWMTQWLVLRSRLAWARWMALAAVLGLVGAAFGAGVAGLVSEAAAGAGFGVGYGAVTGGAVVFFSGRESLNGAARPRRAS